MFDDIKEIDDDNIQQLRYPESIRTPGRTWTRYSEKLQEEFTGFESFEPEIETEGDVEVFTNTEAVEEASDKFFELIRADENKLNYLHAKNVNTVVYIKASGVSEAHISYNAEGSVLSHVVVETDPNTELTITEETECSGLNTSFTEIHVADNSTVQYGSVEKPGEFSYSRRKAFLKRDGKIDWLNGIFTGELNRTQIETVLKGDGSETEMTGVWYPVGEQHHDISLHAHHIGDKTKCDMDSRSVVDNEARSLYEGLQNVRQPADDTKSFQDQETLMLSDEAEADASPKLMIENPNVEASHAAAAGTVEPQEQHYLESRGLDDEKAERLVVKGFFEPVMEEIKVPRVKNKIRDEVQRKLEQK